MKFAIKLAFNIFLTGIILLTIILLVVWQYSYNNIRDVELEHSQYIVNKVSISLDQLILEKVKTIRTMACAPAIIEALNQSNAHFGELSEEGKNKEMDAKNKRWMSIDDTQDPFIRQYTSNKVSQYFVSQQENLKNEYGEIFLTNKYGALVASTSKLTTFAHNNKYWWEGAYNGNEGVVFFDDRGYDESAGGYVFGIVIPIKKGGELIGILKANLNILGSISKLIMNSQDVEDEELLLVRSEGNIIYKQGVEPLSARVPEKLADRLQSGDESSFIYEKPDIEKIVGVSEVKLTTNIKGYSFGGSSQSVDHSKGNRGESWFVIEYRPMSVITDPLTHIIKQLLFFGVLLALFLALTALLLGNRTAKPIKILMQQIQQIAKGDFNVRVSVKQKDEIGSLGKLFNNMAQNLQETTTSIHNLNKEVKEREKVELELNQNAIQLREHIEDLDAFSHTVAHDLKTPLGNIMNFSDLLIEDFPQVTKDSRSNKYISNITSNSNQMMQIIDSILTFASLRKSEICMVEINMGEIVDNVLLRLQATREKNDAKIVTPESWPVVLGQMHWIEEVWTNYLSNAIKYGGLSPHIVVGYDSDFIQNKSGNFVRFWVKDSGPGISVEKQNRLFKKFDRLDQLNNKGHGLGLSIVRRIIEKLGGEVGVISITEDTEKQKRGSRFYFTLPTPDKSK